MDELDQRVYFRVGHLYDSITSGEIYWHWKWFREGSPWVNHFNSPSHSLGDMTILGLLQCHNEATRKLEEQYFILRLGSLHMEFT
eukprot:g18973.t1